MDHLVALKIQDTYQKYRILQKLGDGGQGDVYLAQDLEDPNLKVVALKQQKLDDMLGTIKTSIIKQHQCLQCQLCNLCNYCQQCNQCAHQPQSVLDAKQFEEASNDAKQILSKELLRLLREISSIQLKHLNIVDIYDSFLSTDNKFIIISELAQQDLKKFVDTRFKQNNKLTVEEITMILIQVLNGLEYIHNENFIHRDISPQNILVFKDQTIKICDFGFASYGEQTNANVGKQEYMAPEVNNGNQNYNKSIDIWSLGIMLYYLCTGSTNYQGKSVNNLAREQKRIYLPQEHQQFQKIFDSMIRINPSNRPTATHLKDEFMTFIDQSHITFQKYQTSLLTHLTIQQQIKLQKQQESFQKQILRNFDQELIKKDQDLQVALMFKLGEKYLTYYSGLGEGRIIT
ncbi:serine threonine-specific protein kinase [Stylonychia lemnae]|uniref:Serine threonine-specific protein kinase n=1 Tax=Stylonychia lemnae TaxID=5949 RepID=A0A078A258_STYLE|nr:serine threonine-specific protein kinase [Stylonychia lemnae]|eukprot:CDW74839.1 serine threonine-specific protein kinase [Stylonychia lemnae]